MDVELRVQDRLVELAVTARVRVPMKPLTEATVVVDVPVTPTLTVRTVGLAVIVKSWTWTVTLAGRDKGPFVAETVAR